MLKQQTFDIDGIIIKLENHNDTARILVDNSNRDNPLLDCHPNEMSLPLPQFRKLMDILSKTKFMFSNENK